MYTIRPPHCRRIQPESMARHERLDCQGQLWSQRLAITLTIEYTHWDLEKQHALQLDIRKPENHVSILCFIEGGWD